MKHFIFVVIFALTYVHLSQNALETKKIRRNNCMREQRRDLDTLSGNHCTQKLSEFHCINCNKFLKVADEFIYCRNLHYIMENELLVHWYGE